MAIVCSSTYPSSRSPCRNPSTLSLPEEGELADRNPISGTFFGCCASAKPVISKTVISKQRRTRILLLICSFILYVFTVNRLPMTGDWLPDHLVRPQEHVGRNRESNLLGCFEIYHQLELRRLLDRKIGGLGALEDFVHVRSCAAMQFCYVRAVGDQTTTFRPFSVRVYSRQPSFCRNLYDSFSVSRHGRNLSYT